MLSKSMLVQQDGLPIWRRQRRWLGAACQDQTEGDGERGAGGLLKTVDVMMSHDFCQRIS